MNLTSNTKQTYIISYLIPQVHVSAIPGVYSGVFKNLFQKIMRVNVPLQVADPFKLVVPQRSYCQAVLVVDVYSDGTWLKMKPISIINSIRAGQDQELILPQIFLHLHSHAYSGV